MTTPTNGGATMKAHPGTKPFQILEGIDRAAADAGAAGVDVWTISGTTPPLRAITSSSNVHADLAGTTWPLDVHSAAISRNLADGHNGRTGRSIYLIQRDGTETLFLREPTTGAVSAGAPPADFTIGGQATWALRRSLGLPSQAATPSLPTTRKLAIAAAALDLITDPPQDGMTPDQVCTHIVSEDGYHTVVAVAEIRYGLSANTWNNVHEQAMRQARAVDKASGRQSALSTYLHWCDAGMWANHVQESTPTLSTMHQHLNNLTRTGVITVEHAQQVTQRYLQNQER